MTHLYSDEEIARLKAQHPHKGHENPCVGLYGFDPQGRKCKDCIHLFVHHCSKRYYKCNLRKFTHGPGSDHRVNWPACAKYEALTSCLAETVSNNPVATRQLTVEGCFQQDAK